MSIVLDRVADRQVHGQIVEARGPFCHATRIIVASDEVKENRIQRIAIESCESNDLAIKVEGIEESLADMASGNMEKERLIIIFPNLKDLILAYRKGLRFADLNIGNLHHNGCGRMITPSVSLDSDDDEILQVLLRLGIKLDIRAVPSDRPIEYK